MKRILIATALFASATAFAGRKAANQIVSIYTNSAYGSVGAARNSADTVEQIGCQVYQYSSGMSFGACWANDKTGKYVSCNSSDPAMLSMMRSLQGDSAIAFYWDTTTGACSELLITNGSSYEPKQP